MRTANLHRRDQGQQNSGLHQQEDHQQSSPIRLSKWPMKKPLVRCRWYASYNTQSASPRQQLTNHQHDTGHGSTTNRQMVKCIDTDWQTFLIDLMLKQWKTWVQWKTLESRRSRARLSNCLQSSSLLITRLDQHKAQIIIVPVIDRREAFVTGDLQKA